MKNNKRNATQFIYRWVDENVVPNDTGALSDMLIDYGKWLIMPDLTNVDKEYNSAPHKNHTADEFSENKNKQ